jgi:hypothetical protein
MAKKSLVSASQNKAATALGLMAALGVMPAQVRLASREQQPPRVPAMVGPAKKVLSRKGK